MRNEIVKIDFWNGWGNVFAWGWGVDWFCGVYHDRHHHPLFFWVVWMGQRPPFGKHFVSSTQPCSYEENSHPLGFGLIWARWCNWHPLGRETTFSSLIKNPYRFLPPIFTPNSQTYQMITNPIVTRSPTTTNTTTQHQQHLTDEILILVNVDIWSNLNRFWSSVNLVLLVLNGFPR